MDCDSIRDAVVDAARRRSMCVRLAENDTLFASPFAYSDGDRPELRVTFGDGGIATITDFGSALNRLEMNDVAIDGDRVRQFIGETVRGYGITLTVHGHLQREVAIADLGLALNDMAAALLQIDSLRMLRQATPEPRFAGKLVQYLLSDLPLQVVRNAVVHGNTGKPYRITAKTLETPRGAFLIQAVTKGSTSERTRIIDHTYRVFSDVNGAVLPRHKLSVLADPPGSYAHADLVLLEKVSTLATWSERERIVHHIMTAVDDSERLLFERDSMELPFNSSG
jgi:Domain of unknown function DUF1828